MSRCTSAHLSEGCLKNVVCGCRFWHAVKPADKAPCLRISLSQMRMGENGHPQTADNARFGPRSLGKTADNARRSRPARVVCGLRAFRDAETKVVCVSGTPVCAYSSRRDAEPQTTTLVCGFNRVPKAATADNVWSNQRYAPTYVSLKWLPSGYRELPDNKGLALAADADAQPSVWGACLRVRRVLKYRPHCLG